LYTWVAPFCSFFLFFLIEFTYQKKKFFQPSQPIKLLKLRSYQN
jgi:hypothetical protein